MSAVHSSVETVNAAATAIVTAESRVQPPTHRKKKWASFWSLYSCFKSQSHSKRFNQSALVPEHVITAPAGPSPETLTHPTAILLPFVVPPSSPASFLQSDPPSATQTPVGPLSANANSPTRPTSIYATGPYAHETQLVSPPVFSTFTTEPSTASFTPPVESVQATRPSSPEVQFAQLLASSLGRGRKNSGPAHQKHLLSQYDFQPYQQYQGSLISNLISPGSVVSNSGTSSPYLDKNYSLKFYIEEVPKILASETFSNRKWGSRLDSGTLTPEALDPLSGDRVAGSASLANSDNNVVANHRVSFELNHDDVSRGVEDNSTSKGEEGIREKAEEYESPKNYRSISFGSAKDFNFDNSKGEFSGKSEWWANEKIIGEDLDSQNNWTFFPLLKSGVI